MCSIIKTAAWAPETYTRIRSCTYHFQFSINIILKNVTANGVGTEIKLTDILLLLPHISVNQVFLNIPYINTHWKDNAELEPSGFSQEA
jgi:hypothetical protein